VVDEQTVLHLPPSDPHSVPSNFDADVLTQVESALAAHLGPMAAVLVRRKAKASATLEGLRSALADDIESEPSRRVFMEATEGLLRRVSGNVATDMRTGTPRSEPTTPSGSTQATAIPRFDDRFLAAVETELAHHLGPLARVLIKKSAAKARDRAELFLMLSDHIADETQRRAFIRKSVAAFKDQH
jgi:serine/threonine-protein kinase